MWGYLISLAVSLVISYVTRPKIQKPDNAKPREVTEPETRESTPMSVTFGTVRQKLPAVLWYGDLGTEPIYAEGEGGKK